MSSEPAWPQHVQKFFREHRPCHLLITICSAAILVSNVFHLFHKWFSLWRWHRQRLLPNDCFRRCMPSKCIFCKLEATKNKCAALWTFRRFYRSYFISLENWTKRLQGMFLKVSACHRECRFMISEAPLVGFDIGRCLSQNWSNFSITVSFHERSHMIT